jgi:Fic family protein
MIKIEQKKIRNKPFLYLTEQVEVSNKFKKIQVYIGKNIPNNLNVFLDKLSQKEINLYLLSIKNVIGSTDRDSIEQSLKNKIEINRIKFKYFFEKLKQYGIKTEILWRDFAIRFIFESNSIEGSKLSQKEVEKIVKKQYISKKIDRKEVVEVNNSIKAFNLIRSGKFILNQQSIKDLHKIVVKGLDIDFGYKKEEIVVNNKKTTSPKKVRSEMTKLLNWWKTESAKQKKKNKFLLAIEFHQKFELIHPFSDGNGRVGRLILIWMLLENKYGVILFKNQNRIKYFAALDSADEGRYNKLYKYSVDVYEKTFKDFQNTGSLFMDILEAEKDVEDGNVYSQEDMLKEFS